MLTSRAIAKPFLTILLVLLLQAIPRRQSIAVPAADGDGDQSHRPNILLFLVDDLGWQDTSVAFAADRTRFNDHFRTPHLERLARQGVKFTHAYACTVCSPSRTSIMTGLNAARHRVTNWTLFADQETSNTTHRLGPPSNWRKRGLQPSDRTLARTLQAHGYRTIQAGKAHWGAYDTPGSDPTQLGFDVSIGGHAAGGPGGYAGEDNYGNTTPGSHTRPWGVPGLEAYHGTKTHLTDALTLESKQHVAKAVQDKQPFFLYFAPYAVHAPIQPHPRFIDNYQDKDYPNSTLQIPEPEANYASMVEGVDNALGSLLAQLEHLGVAEETIVLFLSDNGGLSRHARGMTPYGGGRNSHVFPLREGKGSAYEGGTRIPLVASWAKPNPDSALQQAIVINAGSTQTSPVMIEDVMPTVLHWAGTASADDLDGQDFTRLLAPLDERGKDDHQSNSSPRDLVFHYPHQWSGPVEGGYQPHSSIRQGKFKAIYFYETQRWELYNLEADQGEEFNLAATHPDQLQQLARALKQRLEAMQADWPVLLRTGKPTRLRLPTEIHFPSGVWSTTTPEAAGWNQRSISNVAEYLGGRGMIVHDGRKLFQWGDVTQAADVASAAKPLFVHFLARAVQDGRLSSFEDRAATWSPTLRLINEELGFKDQQITFRHLATQTSCYGVSELPGAAFNYNDYQTALFFDTLFVQMLRTQHNQIDERWLRPFLIDDLGCQDFPSFLAFGDADRAGRLRISPRDFCRFGLLYLRGGQWNGKPIVDPAYVRLLTESPLPLQLPRTRAVEAEMLPGQRSMGSRSIPDDQTDHLGCYSWMWWVNGKRASGKPLWPDAPYAYACLGHQHGRRGMVVVPTWDLVISWNDSRLDQYPWGDPQHDPHPLNRVFQLLREGEN